MSVLQQLSGDVEELVTKAAPAVVGVRHSRGHGTGFVLTPDGYVLTNRHVIDGAGRVSVRFDDGREREATLQGADARTDLAVLRVREDLLPTLPLAAERNVRVGQIVVAIGHPLGLERSVSLGVVSALDRSMPLGRGHTVEGLLQTDAAVNPGNSGGPLVAADGSAVGVTTAMIPWAHGIGFAVPSHTASWVASVLIQRGRVDRPTLGIAARSERLGPEAAAVAGRTRGIHVLRVEPSSAASRGGLKEGDWLLTANGAPIVDVDDLQRIMVLGGGEIAIGVWRERLETVAVRLKAAA